MNVEEWFEKYKYKCDSFRDIKRLIKIKEEKGHKISVIIPTLNEEKTVGKVVQVLHEYLVKKYPLVDEILVIDSGSTDNTQQAAEMNGPKFVLAEKVLKKKGDWKGKGENLWKSLYVAKGSIICWVDADIENIHPRFV